MWQIYSDFKGQRHQLYPLNCLKYYHICEKSSTKPFVAPEEAACNMK